jgi:hypothetical protein
VDGRQEDKIGKIGKIIKRRREPDLRRVPREFHELDWHGKSKLWELVC